MKFFTKHALAALFVGLLLIFTQNAKAQSDESLPNLRGARAVELLRQTDGYDSLRTAYQAARRKNAPATESAMSKTAVETDQLTAPNGAADDNFGNSVAVSGDTAVIGAPFVDAGGNTDQGSAYVFTRSGTTWTQQAQLFASDGIADDVFGISVAISGETIIVGAYAYDNGTNADQGAAYIFTRSGTAWSQQAVLFASDGAAGDLFGNSVGLSGDTAVVGAFLDNVGANNLQGSAYVFTRSGTIWTQQAQLNATGGAANDLFGESIAISTDTVVVGADGDDVGGSTDQGSAYVFVRSGAAWTQQAQLNATGGAANDFFGFSVGISGNSAIIGADGDDVGSNANQGSAYIFVRSGTTWMQQAQLNQTGGAAGDNFGGSVAISGDNAVIGAPFDDVGSSVNQGSAYVFQRSGTLWTQKQQFGDGSSTANDQFGYSVAVSGTNIVVGAPFSDASSATPFNAESGKSLAPTATDQGAVFFYTAPLAPTAATVYISGRVVTPKEYGLLNALVSLTDSRGNTRTTITGKFGSFFFTELAAGETYVISVSSKSYNYAPQVVTPNANIAGIIFTPAQ